MVNFIVTFIKKVITSKYVDDDNLKYCYFHSKSPFSMVQSFPKKPAHFTDEIP